MSFERIMFLYEDWCPACGRQLRGGSYSERPGHKQGCLMPMVWALMGRLEQEDTKYRTHLVKYELEQRKRLRAEEMIEAVRETGMSELPLSDRTPREQHVISALKRYDDKEKGND